MVATVDTMTVLNRIKFERSELLKAAEAVLIAMADNPASVDSENKCIFDELRWDDRTIARELGRVQQLRHWKPRAGTNTEYCESVEFLEALRKSVPKKVDEYQTKIDELVAKRDAENFKLAQAQQRLDAMDHARKMLRDLVPAHIKKSFDDELSTIRCSDSADRMRELRNRRKMIHGVIENLSKVDANTVAAIRLHCQSVGLLNVVPPPDPNFEHNRRINEPVWFEYLEQLRAELPSVEAELSDLEMSIDEQLANAESILDFYIEGGK
jgi:hypothetical protein